MFALLTVGPQLEAALGRARFLALYVLSALGGSTLSLLLSAPGQLGVGASGAIFGLFGAFYVVLRRLGGDTARSWPCIGINLVITFAVPIIDWRAHVGGPRHGRRWSPRPSRTPRAGRARSSCRRRLRGRRRGCSSRPRCCCARPRSGLSAAGVERSGSTARARPAGGPGRAASGRARRSARRRGPPPARGVRRSRTTRSRSTSAQAARAAAQPGHDVTARPRRRCSTGRSTQVAHAQAAAAARPAGSASSRAGRRRPARASTRRAGQPSDERGRRAGPARARRSRTGHGMTGHRPVRPRRIAVLTTVHGRPQEVPVRDAVIVEAVRTPTGKRNGGLAGIHPADLSAHVLRALVERTGIDPVLVDDVSGAASRRSASRPSTSRAPRCCRPAGPSRCPAPRSTASAAPPAGAALRRGRRDRRPLRHRGRRRRRVDVAGADGHRL